jgi:hypothetical protein
MTRDEITARIAELEAANSAAPVWGSACEALYGEIKGLERALHQSMGGGAMTSPFENDPDFIDEAIAVREQEARIAELEADNERLRSAMDNIRSLHDPDSQTHQIADVALKDQANE